MENHWNLIILSIFILVSNSAGDVYQEPECDAVGGTCMLSTDCASGTPIAGKCPQQPATVKCCLPCGDDVIQESACSGSGGTCTCNCKSGVTASGKCPTQPADIKCCIPQTPCGGGCSTEAINAACEIWKLQTSGKIWLKPDHFNPLGNDPYDGASARDNIKDTCEGKQVRRSSYEYAPGGCVCLKKQMLQAMYYYAIDFYERYGQPMEVNSIAGSSHSPNSWHYQGNTMDVSCVTPLTHCNDLVNFCRNRGALELCYPGSSCGGHETWVHCSWEDMSKKE